MKSGSTAKLGLALVLFAFAVVLYFVMRSGENLPADRTDLVHYHCTVCDAGFELGADAPDGTFINVERNVENGGEPQARRRSTKATIERVAKCPTCGQHAGLPGRVCTNCGVSYRLLNEKGQSMICPKCKWDPLTGREAEGERLEVLYE
jgi:ribosomal protein L32